MGFGGVYRSMILPSTSTWPAGGTIGRLWPALEVVLDAIVALIILVGKGCGFLGYGQLAWDW